jgi:hypothetical protein
MARRPLITDAERRSRLAWRHHLAPGTATNDIAALTDDLVAVHSSDPVSVHLALGTRMAAPSIGAVERALYDNHLVLRHHAMRRTLWVMTPDAAVDAHASSTVRVGRTQRRRHLKLLGWEDDRFQLAIDAVAAELSDEPVTTAELGERLPELSERTTLAAGTPNETMISALSIVLLHVGFTGRTIRDRPDSWKTSQYRWLAPWVDFPTGSGRHADMLRRWLARFGPGTETDLVWWTGWTKTSVRKALEAVQAVEVDLENGSVGWVLPEDTSSEKQPPRWVALLPGLDSTAMGWKERAWYLDPAHHPRVVDRNGNIGPTIWADGRVVGGWAQRPSGDIAVELYESVDQGTLESAIDRLQALVGDERFRVRFPAPNQRDLLA